MGEGEQGFFVVDRAALALLWHEPGLCRTWLACLALAAYRARRVRMPGGHVVELATGEFVTTREAFGRHVNGQSHGKGEPVASARTIWRWLAELGDVHGLLRVDSGERWTVVRVLAADGEKTCPDVVPMPSRAGDPATVPTNAPTRVPTTAAGDADSPRKEIELFADIGVSPAVAVVPMAVPAVDPTCVPTMTASNAAACPDDVPYKKEVTKNKKSKTLNPSSTGDAVDSEFSQFWTLYPRKEAKIDAFKAWKVARRSVALDTLLAGLTLAVEMWRRDGREVKHIPNPARWLRGGQWANEYAPSDARKEGRSTGGAGPRKARSHYVEPRR